MKEFTGLEYIKIDIANHYGMDKELWEDRIKFVDDNRKILWNLVSEADDPILFTKGLYALEDAENGIPTGFIMGLDATASGLQIMAALSGCIKTASNVNLINTKKREDIYSKIANHMNSLNANVDRATIKRPLMTFFYGSKAKPKEIFGDGTPTLEAFYKTLMDELPGATELLYIMQACWQPTTLKHSWTLPDGHRAVVKVTDMVDVKVEVDELNHATFTYRTEVNKPMESGLSLAAK